jgi:hypothetical protein
VYGFRGSSLGIYRQYLDLTSVLLFLSEESRLRRTPLESRTVTLGFMSAYISLVTFVGDVSIPEKVSEEACYIEGWSWYYTVLESHVGSALNLT